MAYSKVDMQKKKALVAGGAGFVGSHLCERLLNEGYDVTAMDCLVTGRKTNIEPLMARGLKYIEHDINEVIPNSGIKYDEIYNMASPASPVDFKRIPVFILRTAAVGHFNLLELGRKCGARVLFASSSEVYGDALVHPQVETYCGNVNPVGARGCYDEAKRYGESLSLAFWRQYQLPVRIVRIFNTYGPRMRPDDGRIIPNFFIQALQGQPLSVYGDGSQTRSYCFVTDLVDGIFKLMQSDEYTPVNIGNPIERTVLEIAKTINDLTGNTAGIKNFPLPENDPKQRKPDTTRASRLLGWKPQVDLATGLELSMNYFRSELKLAGKAIDAPICN